MEFSELQQRDSVGAFSNYVSIAEAKASGLLPEAYHSAFKDRCAPYCNSERIITKSLSSYMCCNPRCPIKISLTLAYMFNKFQCKNVGPETCKTMVRYALDNMPGKSHIYFLTHGTNYIPISMGSAAADNFKQAVNKVRSAKMSFAEMVSKLGIPKFDSIAIKVFKDIENTQHLIDEVKAIGGLKNFLWDRGVYDPMKIFYLSEFLTDIAFAEYHVFNQLSAVGKVDIPIVLTGHINLRGAKITKDQFVSLCNEVGEVKPGLRLFNVTKTTAIESVDFIIADGDTVHAKYIRAKEREMEEGKIDSSTGAIVPRKILYSSEEFIQMLKDQVEYFKENLLDKDNDTLGGAEVF